MDQMSQRNFHPTFFKFYFYGMPTLHEELASRNFFSAPCRAHQKIRPPEINLTGGQNNEINNMNENL
jgi:hypothetical protein